MSDPFADAVFTQSDQDYFDGLRPIAPTASSANIPTFTQEDQDLFDGLISPAPPLGTPRADLIAAKLPAIEAGEAAASKVTQIESVARPVNVVAHTGKFLRALVADVANSAIDQKPSTENLYAAWKMEQQPTWKAISEMPNLGARITGVAGNVIESIPSFVEAGAVGGVIGAVTKFPTLAQSVSFGGMMGKEAYDQTEGNWGEALKAGAIGAAFPVVGKWASGVGSRIAKRFVDNGWIAKNDVTKQKAVEWGTEMAAFMGVANALNVREYANAESVPQLLEMGLLTTVENGLYMVPGFLRVFNPQIQSHASKIIAEEAAKGMPAALESAVTTPDFGKKLAEAQASAVKQQTPATEVSGGEVGAAVSKPVENMTPDERKADRKRIQKELLLASLDTDDINKAFQTAGYQNIDGFWVHPHVDPEWVRALKPETKRILREKGIVYIDDAGPKGENSFSGQMSKMSDGTRGITVKSDRTIGQALFTNKNAVALHEVGHHIWQDELTQEQRDNYKIAGLRTEHGKEVLSGKGRGEKYIFKDQKPDDVAAEEDFAQNYAENDGDLRKALQPKAEKVVSPTETEVSDASQIGKGTTVPEREVRPLVGETPPLRQPGETAPIRAPEADKRAAGVPPPAPVIDPATGLYTIPGTEPSPVDAFMAAERARAVKAPTPPEEPSLSPGTKGTAPNTPEQQPARVPGEVAAKTEAQKVKDYAAAMAPSAVSFIKRAIESGKTPKESHLAWAREIGIGLQDVPDEVYRKERSGLYTSSYVRSVLGTIEGVVLNAKEYFKAVDEGRQEGIKWKEGVMERQRAITAPEPPPSPAKQKEPWEMTKAEYAVDLAKKYPSGKLDDGRKLTPELIEEFHRASLNVVLNGPKSQRRTVPIEVLADYPDLQEKVAEIQIQAEIQKEKTGTGPLNAQERVELNELRQIRQYRGSLGRLNQARLEWLEQRDAEKPAAAPEPATPTKALLTETGKGGQFQPPFDSKLAPERPEPLGENAKQLKESAQTAIDEAEKISEPLWDEYRKAERELKAAKIGYNDEKIAKAERKYAKKKAAWEAADEATTQKKRALWDLEERAGWDTADPFNKWVWRMTEVWTKMPKGPERDAFEQKILSEIDKEWIRATGELMTDPSKAGAAVGRIGTLNRSVLARPLDKSNQISNIAKTASRLYEQDVARAAAEDEVAGMGLSHYDRPSFKESDPIQEIQRKLEEARVKAKAVAKAKREQEEKEKKEAEAEAIEEQANIKKWAEAGTLQWSSWGSEAGGVRWKAVEGKEVKLEAAPKNKFFVWKNGDQWIVVESGSGKSVGKAGTRKAAIEVANEGIVEYNERMKERGKSFSDVALEEAKKMPPKPTLESATSPSAKPIRLGPVEMEHRGGEIPNTPGAKDGMKILEKAIGDMGDVAKRFTGIRFDKSTGFGLEVRGDEPQTLVVDPERLAESAKMLRGRYLKGTAAAVDEEIIHSFQHEVLNALEKSSPGIGKRMFDELSEADRKKTWELYGSKLGEAETVLEYLRMKYQKERGVLTEKFTRRAASIFKQPLTQTMRDFTNAVAEFVRGLFGEKMPTQIQAFYDAVVKMKGEAEKGGVVKKPWEMTRAEAAGEYKEPYSVKEIQEATKRATGARSRFRSKTGAMVPPAISGEISSKISRQEATAEEMRQAYRDYVDAYKRRSEEHYNAVSQALREGKPVPATVLADYPDLKPTATREPPITLQAARVQTPEDIKRQEQAKRLFLSGMNEREVADEVNHTRNYGYGPIRATLEKGRAAFQALPDSVKQFLPFISNKLNASDTAAGDQPIIPRNPGETLKSYAERLTTGTDKEVREQHTADILVETCDQFQDLHDNRRDLSGIDIPREAKKLQEILAERETLKFEQAMELTSAEHTISEDILHNYQRRLLNARDAIKAVARRTAEQDTMLELYQEQLDMLEGFVRNNEVIGKMLTDATKVFTEAELADPNLTAKQIAKRLETADLPHVTKDPQQRKFLAGMLAEWRDLRQELQTLKGAGELSAKDFSEAIQAKMADMKALKPGEVKKVMNAYATAKAKEKVAWELVKRNQKAWQKQADKLDNMLKALDWLDEFMNSPEHLKDEMELAREYNITYQAFKEDSVTGARTYTNPNPIPEDPELAALYVPSVTVDPAREWTRENFKENWNKLNTYRAWLNEYMANGKDPRKILMAERQAYILDSFHLNPELNPEIGRALRPVPWWMDPWQLLGKITGIRSPYHVARMMPGRMGNEVYAALIRWNMARTRAMPVLANVGRKVQDACLAAAKSHGMTLTQWSETINNRILHSRNVAGVTPEGENTHYPWDDFTVTREDMDAVRAQRDMANKMRRDALPEDDPVMMQDQLKIVVKDAQISREAQGGPYTMRRKWSEAGMTIAEKLYTMAKNSDWAGIRKLLDGDYMLNNFVMRHIHDAVFDADYTVGKSSPLLNTYRDYMQRLILEPGKWRATSLDDLSNKLVDCGAVDAKGELMSPAQVRSIIASEFVKQAKNIYEPSPGVKVPEGRTGPEVTIETGDNFLTIPRGETVASGGFYDYSLATAEQQMAFYGDIERPYYARYISALTQQTDAIRNRIKDLEGEISRKYGTGIGDWKRSRLIRKETRQQRTEKDIWLDYDDLKMQLRRHESLLTQLNAHMDNMRSRTGAMHFFGWLKRIISAHLLSPPQTGIRNVGGSRTMGAALSMLMGTRYAPFAEHRFMNDLASAYHRIPLLSDTTNLAKDMTVYAYEIGKTLLKFLERLPTDNEPVRKAIQTIRKDPRRWGRFLVAVADQIHRNQVEFDRLVANGIVDRANLWQHIRADVAYARTAGEATKELGSIPEQAGNVAKTGVNLLTRGPSAVVGAYENMGNRAGIMDAERNIAHWEANILNAYENRRATGVSIDDSTLSPQEIIGRHESEKQWAHLRALLGPGVNLQYMAKRFAKEYFAAKDAGKPTEGIELMTEGEKEHLVSRYVELVNKGTAGTRPPPAGPLANLMDTFWRYGFYQTEIFSEARGKLAADTWRFDPNFYTSRMIYMYALSGLLFMAPITWVISNLFRKERAAPKPSQASSWSDLAMISMIHSQSLVPPVWSFMISIPSQVFGSKWSVNTGMSVVPISLINSGWNWMREMVQTHDALRPTVKLVSQWMPFTQIPLNRDPAFAGTRALKNANILLGVNGTAAGTEMRPAASGPAGAKTPLTPVIDDLVNYLVAPNGPNWQEVYSLMGKARQMLIDKGNMEPDQTINRMVMARTPMQSRVGRQMTASEVAKTAARYAPEDYAELARIEGAFAQFAAVTGGPAPAALTMPKESRRDLLAGGGGPSASAMAGPPGGGTSYSGGGGPRMVSAGPMLAGTRRAIRMPALGAGRRTSVIRRGRKIGRGIGRRPAVLRRLKVKSAKVRLASLGRRRPYRMAV